MTNEELARFALVLRECDRIRAMIAEDEAAAGADGGGELPMLAEAPAAERSSGPAVVAAAA